MPDNNKQNKPSDQRKDHPEQKHDSAKSGSFLSRIPGRKFVADQWLIISGKLELIRKHKIVVGLVGVALLLGILGLVSKNLIFVAPMAILLVLWIGVTAYRNKPARTGQNKPASSTNVPVTKREPFNWGSLLKPVLFVKHRWPVSLGRWEYDLVNYLSPAVRNPLKPSSDFKVLRFFQWDWTDWVEQFLAWVMLVLAGIVPLMLVNVKEVSDPVAKVVRVTVTPAQGFPLWLFLIVMLIPPLMTFVNQFDRDAMKIERLGFPLLSFAMPLEMLFSYLHAGGVSDLGGTSIIDMTAVNGWPAIGVALAVLVGHIVIRPLLVTRKKQSLAVRGTIMPVTNPAGAD